MHLLGEPLEKVRTFQTREVRLAMEAATRAARCRLTHPDGTTGASSRKVAADEYEATLERTKRKHLRIPTTKRVYMGPPTRVMKVGM